LIQFNQSAQSVFKWILYNIVVGLAVYWASNLILWFPWSISAMLGMVLMLTIGTAIWAMATYQCLITYPDTFLFKAAMINSLVLLSTAVIMDYIFFVLIRDALKDLYHPTTFYGYGFVAALPFLFVLIFKDSVKRHMKPISGTDWVYACTTIIICGSFLVLIIIFDIHI
jgi:hypothetical protein